MNREEELNKITDTIKGVAITKKFISRTTRFVIPACRESFLRRIADKPQ